MFQNTCGYRTIVGADWYKLKVNLWNEEEKNCLIECQMVTECEIKKIEISIAQIMSSTFHMNINLGSIFFLRYPNIQSRANSNLNEHEH